MNVFTWQDIQNVYGKKEELPLLFRHGTALTVGSFDGPHKGHELLFDAVINASKKQGYEPGVVTFTQSAAGKKTHGIYDGDIATLAQKLAVFEQKGFAFTVVIDFSSNFIKIEGHSFLSILTEACHMKFIAEGQDFRCGYRGSVGMEEIVVFSENNGIGCCFPDSVMYNGIRISSSLIRQCVLSCRFSDAAFMLGRPYMLDCSSFNWEQSGTGISTARRNCIQVVPPAGTYNSMAITPEEKIRTRFFTDGQILRLALPFEKVPDLQAVEFISG
jgi:riboflavin kinase / FMN adenylyltransferase